MKNIDIQVLPVINPSTLSSSDDRLEYGENNFKAHARNMFQLGDAWSNFLQADAGSLQEELAARNLSRLYLGGTAVQLAKSVKSQSEKDMLSSWFTEQSLEIYAVSDVELTKDILSNDLAVFNDMNIDLDLDDLSRLLGFYQLFGIEAGEAKQNIDSKEAVARQKFSKYITEKFQYIFGRFDLERTFTSIEVLNEVNVLLELLIAEDLAWIGWRAEIEDSGSLRVDSKNKKILIGSKRPQQSGKELELIIAHELIGHAYRSVSGQKTDDYSVQFGFAGNVVFEEGLACYIEYALSGSIPPKIVERQIAASLALGQFGSRQFNRHETYEFLSLRSKLLAEASGEKRSLVKQHTIDLDTKIKITDRFYRGGKGVGNKIAVFTKDGEVYPLGFAKAKKYIENKISEGVDPVALFDFLFSGCFDPTDSRHIARMKDLGVIL